MDTEMKQVETYERAAGDMLQIIHGWEQDGYYSVDCIHAALPILLRYLSDQSPCSHSTMVSLGICATESVEFDWPEDFFAE